VAGERTVHEVHDVSAQAVTSAIAAAGAQAGCRSPRWGDGMTDDRKRNVANFGGVNANGNSKWVKGVSANPGGQTKAQVAARRMAAELIGELTDGGKSIIQFAWRVLEGTEKGVDDAKSRRWAAEFLAERYWGRSVLNVDVTQQMNPEQVAMLEALKLSPHERRERIAEIKARALPSAPATPPDDRDDGR
jgi:hypothetical protein